MINSPLNYTWNKRKLLTQIIPLLPPEQNIFVDIFAWSWLVWINSDSKKIILNDNNEYILSLVQYFKKTDTQKILDTMDDIILKYWFTDSHRKGLKNYKEEKHEWLSKYNKEAFSKLKDDYNKNPSVELLFALVVYWFNHYIRFNWAWLYNVPVWKVDYTTSLRDKTVEYSEALKTKNIEILHKDFRDKELYTYKWFYYFDPPYLITQAPYSVTWGEKEEYDLLEILDELDKKWQKFALSNVIEGNWKSNDILKEWSKKYNVHYLVRRYLNANYRKKNITIAKEVLITNY